MNNLTNKYDCERQQFRVSGILDNVNRRISTAFKAIVVISYGLLCSCKGADQNSQPIKMEAQGILTQSFAESQTCIDGTILKIFAQKPFGGHLSISFARANGNLNAAIIISPYDSLVDSITNEYSGNSRLDSAISDFTGNLKNYTPDSTIYFQLDGVGFAAEICDYDSNHSIVLVMPGKSPDTPKRNVLLDKLAKVFSEIKTNQQQINDEIKFYENESQKILE